MKQIKFRYNNQEFIYPEHLTSELPFHEARVIGTLVNDMSLMTEMGGKRNLFHSEDGIMYYDLLTDMYNHRIFKYDVGAVQSALGRLGKDFANKFISINGNGHLSALARDFNPRNFESHMDALMKTNAKINLYKGLYCNMLDLHNDSSIKAEEVLEKMEDVMEITREISEVSNTRPVELRIDEEYIQSKINGVKRGINYGFFSISRATRGLHLGNVSMLSAFGNTGKAQPLHSKIYTPNGYINMGDVKIGDVVYDMYGNECNVIGVFPQGIKDRYAVTFKDGSVVECCGEHLWVANTIHRLKRGKSDFIVESLDKIMTRKLMVKGNTYTTFVPNNKPINSNELEFEVHPYVLGCLIGDGSIKERAMMSSNEQDVVDRVAKFLPENHIIKKMNSNNFSYIISNKNDYKDNKIIKGLKNLNIFGLGSHEKFIPEIYLKGSIEQRMELLKGLFDTDGSISVVSGCKTITTTSDKLRDDIIHLCHTLGYRATYITDNREYKYGKCYSVIISTYDEIFTSEKHKSRVPKNRKVKRRTEHLSIKEINKLEPCEMQCIMVDSPTHTYLTDNMVVTHNTTLNFNEVMLELLDKGESVFVYSNESAIDDFKDMMLIRTLVKHFKYYNLTRTKLNELDVIKEKDRQKYEEYMSKINEAKRYTDEHYGGRLILYSVSRYSISEFNILMRRYSLKGFKYYLIDTMKSEDAGDKQAVGKLVQQSRDIYELARKLNTHVTVSYQIASYLKQNMKRILDESCLSGSKQISEILDILICMRELYPDEYHGQKNEVKVFRLEFNEETKKYCRVYKTLESDKKYLVLFLPKNRYGAKILPTVYQFNGEWGTISEIGFAENIQEKSF